MRGVTFVLGATWLALIVWAGEHAALLGVIALTVVGSRTDRRRHRAEPVATREQSPLTTS